MRVAIVSDIHANLQALEAVLEQIDDLGCEAVWCLGDVVGYGGDPEACVALVRARADLCLSGNHDMGVTGALSTEAFSEVARRAAEWTAEVISPAARSFLASLSPADEGHAVGLYHASPRDPVWEYVMSAAQAELCLDVAARRVSAVGHTHVALAFNRPAEGVTSGEARHCGDELDLRAGQWLLNPGSVGQPRDGDPRAAWLELDTVAWTARFRRTEYDIDAAALAIRRAGLPEPLAERLSFGQ